LGFVFSSICQRNIDDDFLVTQELVDSINSNPKSKFKATLYPKFAKMKVKDAKRFLSPVRKFEVPHTSAYPLGFNERLFYKADDFYLTGLYKLVTNDNCSNINFSAEYKEPKTVNKACYYIQYDEGSVPITVYDNTKFCSTWATAVTSAMSMSLSRWSSKSINLSVQFIIDCDIVGDSCIERPPLTAYEQFWRRYIPPFDHWGQPNDNSLQTTNIYSRELCDNNKGCYEGLQECSRNIVLTGICEPGFSEFGVCPIYFLNNWRKIKSFLAEVGPVTSSILVGQDFFTYNGGLYTPNYSNPIIGMMDVTIIGWGQKNTDKWWFIIP